MDRANGSTDTLDIPFISPNLAKHDIQFQIGDNLGSNHLSIEISIDTTPYPLPPTPPPPPTHTHTHGNTFTNHTKYKFDQTERKVFESTLEEALVSEDFSGHLSTVIWISMLTLSQLKSALRLIKPFRNPKTCDLRVSNFQ